MKKRLIVLTGPTGVGKSDLSIRLANHFNCDIISCDSRQIFKEMFIGTAVPTKEQLSQAKHHFIQSISVSDYYSASIFEEEVIGLLSKLFIDKDTVIMTGGSMMYIDAVCKGIDDIPTVAVELRESLRNRYDRDGIDWFIDQLEELDPLFLSQVDKQNHKRVIHAVEICIQSGEKYSDLRTGKAKKRDFEIVKVCLDRDRTELYDRINLRVLDMINQGLVEEVRGLSWARDLPSMNTVGYKEIFEHLDGITTLDYAIDRVQAHSRAYARKQLSWFRRDGEYKWFSPEDEEGIVSYLEGSKCH